jgi:soluble lytic murein transglycosylase-like protein
MEKRNQNTLARTLRCSAPCVQFTLIATLFVPSFLTIKSLSRQEPSRQEPSRRAPSPEVIETAPLAELPRLPRDLVKIYSIVKANRPDIGDGEVWEMSDVIRQECIKHSLDPILVLALIQVESGFQFKAVSPMGARGIMQIMPDVAQGLAQESGLRPQSNARRFRPEYLDDPVFSIKLGVYYLHDLKKSFRDVSTALVAYNLGPTELRSRLENNIEFSDDYATTVLSIYQRLKKAKQPTF